MTRPRPVWYRPADPDVWRLGQLGRTALVDKYLSACMRPGRGAHRRRSLEAVPGMGNGDMIAAILYARDAAGIASVKAAGQRAWEIRHGLRAGAGETAPAVLGPPPRGG
jgi:hypothetical protein